MKIEYSCRYLCYKRERDGASSFVFFFVLFRHLLCFTFLPIFRDWKSVVWISNIWQHYCQDERNLRWRSNHFTNTHTHTTTHIHTHASLLDTLQTRFACLCFIPSLGSSSLLLSVELSHNNRWHRATACQILESNRRDKQGTIPDGESSCPRFSSFFRSSV